MHARVRGLGLRLLIGGLLRILTPYPLPATAISHMLNLYQFWHLTHYHQDRVARLLAYAPMGGVLRWPDKGREVY